MVNKLKGDAKELRAKAKKKKTDKKNKGYQSAFEHFSDRDEEVLQNCCNEVAKSLEEIFSKDKQPATENNKVKVDFNDVASAMKNPPNDRVNEKDEMSVEESTEADSTSYRDPPPTRRRSDTMRRRSSLGTLAQFVRRNSTNDDRPSTEVDHKGADGKGISEATLKFKFRSSTSAAEVLHLQQREMERRESDQDYKAALIKRKRMVDYHRLRSKEQD
jgi:hypothetical protein